jgi:predicted Ser/Thr protein kinase
VSVELDDTQPASPESGGVAAARTDELPESVSRFAVKSKLGEGGNGVVLLAADPALGRDVAIKMLRRGSDAEASQRLLREAQSAAKLSHENIIVIHEVGTVDEHVYVAMEYVTGGTLRQWQQGRPWRACLDAYVRAGRGLAAAHAAGLVHRDFKPDNVLVGNDGRLRVTDFGLVCSVGDVSDGAAPTDVQVSVLTKTGVVMGTPRYMAPEQHAGEPVDARTDQFAFCVALYEALYGQPPFSGDTYRELADNVLAGNVRAPTRSDIPPSLRDAIVRGLSRDRDARFPSMTDLLAALSVATTTSRRRWPWILGAVLIAAAIAVLLVWSTKRSADAPRTKSLTEATTAEEAYQLGEAAYNNRDFPAAIAAFKHALALDFTQRAYFFNLGQAYRMNGECREAIFAFRAFLGTSQGSSTEGALPQVRLDVEKRILALEDCLAEIRMGSASNACGCQDR